MSLPYSDSNLRPLILSLAMHAALALILAVGLVFSSKPEVVKPPAVMKAALVYAPDTTLRHQAKTQTQKREKPTPQAEPEKKVEQKKEQPKKVEQPKPKPVDKPTPIKADKPKETPKAAEPKKEPVKQEQKKAEPKKKEPEKKPEPPKKDAKQADKKQDALSQKKMENVSKDAERAIETWLEHDEFEMEGELSDDETMLLMGLLASRVADMWERPPNSRRNMQVTLAIELASNGKVISAHTVKSSGDRAFDLAAEVAVRRVDEFPEVKALKPAEFKKFRKFNFLFRPDDLEY